MISGLPTLAELTRERVDPTSCASDSARGVELREIVQILRRRGLAVGSILALGILVAFLSIVFAANRYSATATIEVNRDSGSSLGLTDLSGAAGVLGDVEGLNVDLLTQQSVILSDNTGLGVIEQLNLEADAPYAIPAASSSDMQQQLQQERFLPLDQAPLRREHALRVFRSGLRVNLIKGTRLLTITFTDTDPKRAASIANAIVEAYMNESTRARFQASSKTSTWLSGQLTDLKRKVEESQARVDAFQRQYGLAGTLAITPDGKTSEPANNVAVARLVELNRNLTSAEIERIAREAVYTISQTQDPEVVVGIGSGPLAASLGANSPLSPGSADLALLQHLQQQLAQVAIQRATAGTKYGQKNPAMHQLQNEQESIETQIRAELDHIRSRAQSDLRLAVLDEQGIRNQIAQQEQAVNQVTAKTDQLLLLEEEARSSRAIYQDLYTKLEEASVTAGIKASNIALVDPARPPARPSYPKKGTTLALGCFAGLLFGLLSAFTWDYFDDSISAPEDAERVALLPVIGAIPAFHRRRSSLRSYPAQKEHSEDSRAWLLQSPRSHIAEAYRALRTALLLSCADQAPHTILFISGSPEEGKSTTCLNTAAAFALQGDRVLYLDADLRRAKGHTFFGCANDVGLSNCLASGVAFPAALQPHPEIATLFLLPAGPHPPNPSELLGSKRFAELLRELRTHFDYILIDSPPVLLVTDAQLIAPLADGCVLIVRAQKTMKRFLFRSLAQVRTTNASLLGIVVNAFKSETAAYSGYGYYGKRNGYYAEN
ncbi:MAG TPA: polysaccharide biosynthesis tyrosine autokinase [Terracidiphilus sp.]|nr:polysaccharide biosynthesis tyrosine autokinase [Terracidiphilus sp.]